MMHHTRAVILKKEEWHEADWLVTAFSEDFGKIRLLAQGSRKHGAKLQGHLEPGSVAELSFVIGRNGYRLTTARLRFFPALSRGSLTKLRALTAILVALDSNLLEEREGAPALFGLLGDVLAALERAEPPGTIERLLAWFQVRLWNFLGVLPEGGSPEATGVASLLALGRAPLETIDALAFREGALGAELSRLDAQLATHLGPQVRVVKLRTTDCHG